MQAATVGVVDHRGNDQAEQHCTDYRWTEAGSAAVQQRHPQPSYGVPHSAAGDPDGQHGNRREQRQS